MKCEFKIVTEELKKCSVCGFEIKSIHPPEKINRICPNKQPQGLGDTAAKYIEKITFGHGLKIAETVAHAVGAEDCGCGNRQELLNKVFPYQTKENGV